MRIMILIFSLIFSTYTWSATITKAPDNINNIYTEDKLAINITKAQAEFQIKLKSNATTGYSWFLREYNSEIITPIKRTIIPPETKMMGAPGFEVWTFKVKQNAFTVPHQTMIRFIYSRPWDINDQAKQLVFRVST